MPHLTSLLFLAAFGVSWGLTLPLTKIAVSTGHHPFGLIFWQVVIVALALAPAMLWFRRRLRFDRPALVYYAFIGLAGTIVPNGISYYCYTKLPAGIMSIMLSSIPMFSFAVALMLRADRFSWRRIGGIACGMTAIALLVGPQASLPDPALWIFVLLGLTPSICYAFEANYVASFTPPGMDAISSLFGASLVSAIILLPLTLGLDVFVDPLAPWGRPEWALVASSILHAGAYCGFIWLLSQAGAVFSSQVSYIVTLTGVGASSLFLGERYASTVWLALAVMIAGLMLVQPRGRAEVQPAGA